MKCRHSSTMYMHKKKLNSRVLAWWGDVVIGILKGCSCLNCITQRECCSVRQEATTTKTLLRRRRRMKTVTATYRCCDCRIHLVSSSDSSWLVTATHHQLDSCTHFRKVMTKRSRFCISICTRHKLDLVSDDFFTRWSSSE